MQNKAGKKYGKIFTEKSTQKFFLDRSPDFATCVACVTPVEDDSILVQKTCKFPCWHGLVPGKSQLEDVNQVVAKDPFITSASNRRLSSLAANKLVIQWWYDEPYFQNRLVIVDNILQSIEITPYLTFTLGQIIDLYGKPAAVFPLLDYTIAGDQISSRFYLFYPEHGLVVRLQTPDTQMAKENKFEISRNLPGIGFSLYAVSSSIEDFISEIGNKDNLNVSFDDLILDWYGFQTLVIKTADMVIGRDAPLVVTVTPSN